MKRLVLCIVLFCGIIAASCLSLNALSKTTEQLETKARACIRAYENGSPDTEERIKDLEDAWKDYYNKVSFITRSSSLEELAVSVARLDDLTANSGGDFQSELYALIYRARVLYENQLPLPRSIL